MSIEQYAKTIAAWPYGKYRGDDLVVTTRMAFEKFLTGKLEEFQAAAQRDILLRIRVVFEAESASDDMGNRPAPDYLRGLSYAIAVVIGATSDPAPALPRDPA
jgi:hypothetical protein